MHTVGFLLACLACVGCARRVQTSLERSQDSERVRDWELENIARHRAGDMNDAELGLANLRNAMKDPSLLSQVAQYLRQPEGRAELIKLMADPNFQGQAQQAVKQIMMSDDLTDILKLEYYAGIADAPMGGVAKARVASSPNMAAKKRPAAKKPVAKKPAAKKRPAAKKPMAKKTGPADLVALAEAQQIPMGYWDPLKLGETEFWGQSNEATVGYLRHAEIKHGRIAMAGFIGYCVHENGIRWPFPLSSSLPDYSSFEGLSAPAVWDTVPQAGRLQIFAVIGLLEYWSEWQTALELNGERHYMRGGKPGYFPRFKEPLLSLYDPFKLFEGMSEEQKAKRLNREVNNGRLAMLGMMSLVSEARVPGAVPALKGLIKPYDGEVMAPLSRELDTNWQGVDYMFNIAQKFPWNQ